MRRSEGLAGDAVRGFPGIVLATWLIVCLCGCNDANPGKIPALLTAAGLAPLPASATNVAYYHWAGIGTGNAYIKFQTNPSDFLLFLTNSPALRNKEPTKYFDPKHQHLSIPLNSWNSSLSRDHEYYLEGSGDPKWFRPVVLGKGRKYEIDFSRSCWILFDEENYIVWLFTSRG